MKENRLVLGIDLGTTNSCVAIVENGQAQVLENKAGYKTTPSYVAITAKGKRLVGQMAKRQAVTNAEHTVYASKRFIGRTWQNAKSEQLLDDLSYEVVEGPNGDLRVMMRDKQYSLSEIAAMILSELRYVAEQKLQQEISSAIITVPAYFNDIQRQATIDAGKIAGLDVMRIINEPTAAALAYGFNQDIEATIAVYDLGGGTFDISLLRIEGGVYSVLSTAGDTYLGGEDFDNRIIEHFVYDFAKEHRVDLREFPMAMQRLKMAAETLKCELSTVTSAELNLPFIWTDDEGQAHHLHGTLTREELEKLVYDLVDRTLKISQFAVNDADLDPLDIDEIVLVGGMTRMPLIQHSVSNFFGKKTSKNVHPDEAIAIGAALQGFSLTEESENGILLLDVTPLDLGIAIHGGGFHVLIPKNSTVPASASTVFTTSFDNQDAIKIIVMQGTSSQSQDNQLLSEFNFTGIQRGPAGSVDIEIIFDIDADGIVSVSAKDLATQREQNMTITRSSKLSQEEVARMILENKDALANQKQADNLEIQRTKISSLMRELEKALETAELPERMHQHAQSMLNNAQETLENPSILALEDIERKLKRELKFVQPLSTEWSQF